MIIFGVYNFQLPGRPVQDFCPVCRDVRTHSVATLRRAAHLYFIPLLLGRVFAVELTCRQCGSFKSVSREHRPRRRPRGVRCDQADPSHIDARLDAEVRALEQRLTPQQRLQFIAEPLKALNLRLERAVEREGREIKCVFLIALLLALGGAVAIVADEALLATGLFALAVVACIYGARRAARRHKLPIRLGVLQLAGHSLSLLEPSAEELHQVMRNLRGRGYLIAKVLTCEEICAAALQASAHSDIRS